MKKAPRKKQQPFDKPGTFKVQGPGGKPVEFQARTTAYVGKPVTSAPVEKPAEPTEKPE